MFSKPLKPQDFENTGIYTKYCNSIIYDREIIIIILIPGVGAAELCVKFTGTDAQFAVFIKKLTNGEICSISHLRNFNGEHTIILTDEVYTGNKKTIAINSKFTCITQLHSIKVAAIPECIIKPDSTKVVGIVEENTEAEIIPSNINYLCDV